MLRDSVSCPIPELQHPPRCIPAHPRQLPELLTALDKGNVILPSACASPRAISCTQKPG